MVRDVCNSISVRRPARSRRTIFPFFLPQRQLRFRIRETREHAGEPGIGVKEDGVVRRRWTVERKRKGVSERQRRDQKPREGRGIVVDRLSNG